MRYYPICPQYNPRVDTTGTPQGCRHWEYDDPVTGETRTFWVGNYRYEDNGWVNIPDYRLVRGRRRVRCMEHHTNPVTIYMRHGYWFQQIHQAWSRVWQVFQNTEACEMHAWRPNQFNFNTPYNHRHQCLRLRRPPPVTLSHAWVAA